MKINKKNNIHMDLNVSNIQNNQKKDYLRNLNHNVKTNKAFFSRKIFKNLNNINVMNKIFKRDFSMQGGNGGDDDDDKP
jgi:hypothetical protein